MNTCRNYLSNISDNNFFVASYVQTCVQQITLLSMHLYIHTKLINSYQRSIYY